ncbi:uncharacterized protein RHOBADRAFT_26896 [Rhodotorula graminis WP1]|uniref:Xylose isomerase-like TIM barrel domain-containing protein n=1 Tax=Rhodotorula graminis (strain WP1) TaxID=578459 RepID=A0A194S4P1_RHOGW|nr:uncharacterized protein RHOBADRAFT_26896 [Rhodotorula graminis WP1]KPV75552.1 hypothetical protein RHOBADRAFT_26896 [Rhodotorula graminis WP1]
MPGDSKLTRESLAAVTLCYASCSLGKPTDPLPDRLSHLSSAGFSQIELSFPDLQAYASVLENRDVGDKEWDVLARAAEGVKALLDERRLRCFILQPFGQFEGWPEGSDERKDAWERVEGWIKIAKAVGTDTLQVGSSDVETIEWDRDVVVKDLRELCDRLAKDDLKLSYENWCWSTHAPTWKAAWEIVRDVDRDNMTINLDTFQTAGSEWADPTQPSGLVNAASDDERDKRFQGSLDELSETVPADKIGFLQLSDAYKVDPPLEDKTVDGLRPRGRWSHDYRPLPYSGGYLPVEQVTKAVLKTGWRGVMSVEVFDSGPDGKGKEDVRLEDYARDAAASVQRLLDACADDDL